MTIPQGFTEIKEAGVPAGFSLVPEGFSLYEEEDDKTLGVAETALSMATGGFAMPLAGLAGLATGNADNVAKVNEALTYQPRTKTGKKYLENTTQAIEEYARQPLIKAMTPIQMAENEAELVGTIGADALLNLLPLGVITKAGKSIAKGMRENAAKASNDRMTRLTKETPAGDIPDGFQLAEQGELDLFSPDQKQLGVSPYDAIGGKWAVDENGIPFKQEISQELSRVQDGEQARLFDDPIFQEPATKKYVESEAAWAEKNRQQVVADMVTQLQKKFEPPKGQRGVVDLGPDLKGYEVEVEPLTLKDGSSIMVRLKNKDGQLAGFVDFAVREDGVLTAENAQVAGGLRGNGAAAQMYKAAREAGYDIAPGKVQTDLGKTMVESLQRKGLINKEAIGPRFNAGDLNLSPIEGEKLPGYPRGQRGAIDVNAIKSSIEDLKIGVASARNVFDSFKGAFETAEWNAANAAIKNPKSKATIVMMSPDDFHALAAKRTPYEMEWSFAKQSRDDVRGGLKSEGGLWDMPYLKVYPDGDVYGHEGRHRMDVFKEQGIELVPVRLQTRGFEWGSEAVHPTQLTPQFGGTPIPMPEVLTPRAFPKNQRGGIDVKAIGDSLKKMANSLEKPPVKTREARTPEKTLENLPGNRGMLDNYIPNDPTPADILADALKDKDSGIKYNNIQSGATLTGMIHNSALIQGIGRLYQNAGKRSEKNIREQVKPVEQIIMSVPKPELVELGELLKKEMFDGKVYTPEQLRNADFTPRKVDAYMAIRDMFNEVWNVQNQALAALGKKPLTKREAYLSSRWQGGWRSPIYDKEGKLVFYIAETSKSKAKAALKYMAKNAEVDISKSKIEFKNRRSQQHGDLTDAYRTMLAVIDRSDPRAEAVKSVYEEGKANEAFAALGQSKHFETKAGVGGFVGDRPWKSRKVDTVEMFQQQFEYAKNGFTWAELGKATDSAKQVLADPELIASQPNNIAYAQQYAKNKLGFGEHPGVAAIENSLAETFGHDAQTARDILGGMKSIFILQKLGLSPGFIITNLVQPLASGPWHANLSSKGYKHNPFTTLVFAGADGFAGILKHWTGQEVPMSKIGKDALQYAEDNGIVSRDITDENAGLGANIIKQTGDVLGKLTIGTVEHVARLNTFMSFVHHLDQSKKHTDMSSLFQHAEELTNASMVDYRPGERPMVFDQAGLLGSAAANLQTYKFNYYNQLHYFFKEASEGRPRALAAFVAMSGMVGGALSLPFLTEIDDAWEWFKEHAWEWFKEHAPDALHLKIKDFNLKNEMMKHMNELIAFGGMSKITGADMTSRFAPGKLTDWSLDGVFPFISDFYKQAGAAAKAITNPTETTMAQAAYIMAPPGPVQGAVETQMDAFKNGTTPSGKTIYTNPNKLEAHDADYARTPRQETYRQFGLRELGESKYRTLRNRQNLNDKQDEERLKEQSIKFADAIFRKDKEDIQKYANRYIAYGGDADQLSTIIEREQLKQKIPPEILAAAKASSLRAVQKSKKMKELLNGFNY